MDKEEQDSVRVVVEEILAEADINKVSKKQVRELASKKTGVDLSATREWRKFVSNVIKKFMESPAIDVSDAEADEAKKSPDRNRLRSSKKMKKTQETQEMEEAKDEEDVTDEDYEDDEEEAGVGGKKEKYETDEEGNFIICELSAKRKVVVSQWRGKTLVSVREYYEKDGKVLPSSKGISLTTEQFEVLAKSAKNIEAAISTLQ